MQGDLLHENYKNLSILTNMPHEGKSSSQTSTEKSFHEDYARLVFDFGASASSLRDVTPLLPTI